MNAILFLIIIVVITALVWYAVSTIYRIRRIKAERQLAIEQTKQRWEELRKSKVNALRHLICKVDEIIASNFAYFYNNKPTLEEKRIDVEELKKQLVGQRNIIMLYKQQALNELDTLSFDEANSLRIKINEHLLKMRQLIIDAEQKSFQL